MGLKDELLTRIATYQPSVDGKPVMGSDNRASLWLTSWAWDGKRFGKLLTGKLSFELPGLD
jgi:hypothetical protein